MTTTEPRHGLHADILSAPGRNCSANGISARYPGVVIVGVRGHGSGGDHAALGTVRAVQAGEAGLPRIAPADGHRAEVELVVRQLRQGLYVHAEPVERGTGAGPMFGGSYINTGDSRFGELLRGVYGDDRSQVGPIPLHDRWQA